jgi:hypothetical protein
MLLNLIIAALILSSLGLYLSAFFLPEIRRKYDTIVSGLLFFYGLTLSFNANQIHGGLLLGQLAGVIGLLWLGWQALQLRWQIIPVEQRTPLPDTSWLQTQWQDFIQRVTTPTPEAAQHNLQTDTETITLDAEATLEDPTELTMKVKAKDEPSIETETGSQSEPQIAAQIEAQTDFQTGLTEANTKQISVEQARLEAVAKELLENT